MRQLSKQTDPYFEKYFVIIDELLSLAALPKELISLSDAPYSEKKVKLEFTQWQLVRTCSFPFLNQDYTINLVLIEFVSLKVT